MNANARFVKTVINILVCAVFALFYVHQKVEIVKMGFCVDGHRQELTLLLDQYRSLVYNLSRLQSPKSIEDTLYVNKITLSMPQRPCNRAY